MVPKQKGVFAGGFVLDKRSVDLNLFFMRHIFHYYHMVAKKIIIIVG